MDDKIMIGLETHLQLLSKSKLFCGCPTSGSDEPNTRVCPTCLGMPGARPRLNKKVVEMGMKVAEALNCNMPEEMNFSRKSYFYPDMPKNFQITQFSIPLGRKGEITLRLGGGKRKIRIRRIHLEEDPGKIKHVGGDITSSKYTLIDYNRSGVPLCEIVTEPDLKSPKEARIFLRELANIFEYLGIYDSSSEASIRSDANISMGGERTEVKNITGFRGVERGLRYEAKRQKNLMKRGREVTMETRAYDDEGGVTKSLRKKEVEEEYGYIFEPDLTPIELAEEWKKKATEDIPELPHRKRERYVKEFGISEEQADAICSDFELARVFEEVAGKADVKTAANVISGPVKKVLNYNDLRFSSSELTPDKILKVVKMLGGDEITERGSELILREIVIKDLSPRKVKEEEDVGKVSDVGNYVEDVIKDEKEAVEDYRSGKTEALNYLMGQVMQKTKGSADPQKVRKLLKKKLGD